MVVRDEVPVSTAVRRPTTGRRARAPHVVIYVPGLGHYPANTVATVADVLADALNVARAGTYHAETSRETAPRRLRVGKTVIDPHGRPFVELFELDYRHRLEEVDPASSRPAAPPGLVRSSFYALDGLRRVILALRRPKQSPLARAQILVAFCATLVLLVGVLVTLAASLAAMGLMGWVPTGLAETVDLGGSAPTVAVGTGLSTTAVWAKARPAVLQFGVHMRCLQRYLTDEQHRATVTKALADAVDGLLDQGWDADITVVGYSFGSVVAVDALFPPRWDVRELAVQQPSRLTDAVTRLVTIGWPGSAIELFYRDFYRDRRLEGPAWLNVYIPADVLGTDGATSVDPPHPPRRKPAGAPWPLGPELRPSRSLRYTSETLSWGSLVRARGLRSHGGYWDTAQRDSCFRMLVGAGWLPEPASPRPPRPATA